MFVYRITAAGIQQSENPIVSEKQWEAIEAMFADDNLKVKTILTTPLLITGHVWNKKANVNFEVEKFS